MSLSSLSSSRGAFRALSTTLAAASLVLAAGAASAVPITVTFDRGGLDETIYDPDYHGPYAWVEEGVRVSGFWAEQVGQPTGHHVTGHIHPGDNVLVESERAPYGYQAESTHSWTDGLQGLVITLENGGTFDLISMDYDVWFLERTEDPAFDLLPWSWDPSDPKILVSESFDPSLPDFESQWTAFDAISNLDAPGEGDWHTVDFAASGGFTNLTSIMITQSAALTWFDNIVIDTNTTTPVPEPSTALLLGLGLMAAARTGRRA